MKGFLFDGNLPSKLIFQPRLPVVPFSILGSSPSDTEIWEFARRERLVVVTKDADFSGRIILHTPPPWVVHVRFGNLRRKEFHTRVAEVWPRIEALLKNQKLINVHADRVEGIC